MPYEQGPDLRAAANREKRWGALWSLLAAVMLTAFNSAGTLALRRRIQASASDPTSRSEPKGGDSGGQADQIARKFPATQKPETTISIPVNDLRKRCIMNRSSQNSGRLGDSPNSGEFGCELIPIGSGRRLSRLPT